MQLLYNSCSMLLVKAAAPGPHALGTANGVVQFSINLARAISPAVIGFLFSISTEHNLMGGSLWAWFMVVIGIVGLYPTRSLRVASPSRF
jgi:MFS family permease